MVVALRLRRTTDIDRARKDGVARSDRLFTVRALPTDIGAVRVSVSAGRATGSAVARNRARRRLREAVRLEVASRGTFPSCDLVLGARPAVLRARTLELREAVCRHLTAVVTSSGGARP